MLFSYTKALDSIKSLRKERVTDQKAEKERLESLSKEKAHADKLLKRISEMNSSITAKQAEYEETKKEYDSVCVANRKFNDQATHFRQIYMKQEQLTSRRKGLLEELEEMKGELKEIQGPLTSALRCTSRLMGRRYG
jgi:DNA repair protein RAD50